MGTINLMQIVKVIYEEDLEKYSGDDYKEELKKKFDYCSICLREVLDAVYFSVELLKVNGEYRIPREDGEFIQWIIENYKDDNMKLVRKGEFIKADVQFMFILMKGLDELLKHIDIDEDTRMASRIVLRQRTKYDENIRFYNIQAEFYKMLYNTNALFSTPNFRLTYEDKMECLDAIAELTNEYTSGANKICSDIINKRKELIEKNSYPLSAEEVAFSQRFMDIQDELHQNEEFCRLQEELNELKKNKGFLKQYEKEKKKKIKRVQEIINEVSSKYPVKIEEMTKIERIMALTDTPFSIHFSDGKWSITFESDVSWFDELYTMIW